MASSERSASWVLVEVFVIPMLLIWVEYAFCFLRRLRFQLDDGSAAPISSDKQRRHGTRRHAVLHSGHRWGGSGVHDVLGRFERCVDPPLPAVYCRGRRERQVEIERLPIAIENHMQPERELALAGSHGAGNAVRIVSPVRPTEPDAVPVDFGAAQQVIEAQPEPLLITRTQQPEA